MNHPKLEELLRRDPRFPFEAYEFIFNALTHTHKMLDRRPDEQHHVSGQELLHGVRELALSEFGLLARLVFRNWGINTTDDVGDIVFNLIDAELMSGTDQDRRSDFHAVYDMDKALSEGYTISGRPKAEDE